jgi:hypothetical protein
MAIARSTPFIASWHSEDPLDATVPLDEILAARPSPPAFAPAPVTPLAAGPSRLEWFAVGIAGVLALGALVWAAEIDRPRTSAIEEPPARVPPLPVRAELQAIPARLDMTLPDIVLQPPPARTNPQPRPELAAALLERRKQLSQIGPAVAEVDAVVAISFDPARRSARVVYRLENSAAEVVEYWAVRDGRWQPMSD